MQPCQCNALCSINRNCCYDFRMMCLDTVHRWLDANHDGLVKIDEFIMAHMAPTAAPTSDTTASTTPTTVITTSTASQSVTMADVTTTPWHAPSNPGSCHIYGCGDYDRTRTCQCNRHCNNFGSCCSDYRDACQLTNPGNPATPLNDNLAPQGAQPQYHGLGRGEPTLFCFSVIRNTGYEPDVVREQVRRGASIFACDASLVLSDGPSIDLEGVRTVGIVTNWQVTSGNMSTPGTTTTSWLNVLVFMKVWAWMKRDGRYVHFQWTVKVDPDAVFFPERLRGHLVPFTRPPQPLFFTTCNRVFMDNEPFKEKLFGAVEVYSKEALDRFLVDIERCNTELNWHGWGEDFWMQTCLDLLGVPSVSDADLVSDGRCSATPCTDATKVAYHDFKGVGPYFTCWKLSLGEAGAPYDQRQIM